MSADLMPEPKTGPIGQYQSKAKRKRAERAKKGPEAPSTWQKTKECPLPRVRANMGEDVDRVRAQYTAA